MNKDNLPLSSNIKVISFDLDNALYDNRPVLAKAEAASAEYLSEAFASQGHQFSISELDDLRAQLSLSKASELENMTFLRLKALLAVCQPLTNGVIVAEQALTIFLEARSKVTIDVAIEQLITVLSKDFILVTVSNGNCDPQKLSIGHFFKRHYCPELGYRAKPNKDMLQQVISDFDIQPQQLLHVGDSLAKDGEAAKAAGAHFFHFSPFETNDQVETNVYRFREFLSKK